jgi:hypothetical protein
MTLEVGLTDKVNAPRNLWFPLAGGCYSFIGYNWQQGNPNNMKIEFQRTFEEYREANSAASRPNSTRHWIVIAPARAVFNSRML